ncbi:MAG: hypothetical protein J5511_03255 [Bacilli bacterium]|nr:hypothetical protein [Bacilli bacterium]
MKKSKLYLLPLCFLVLTACEPGKGGNDVPPDGETKLATPVLSLNAEQNGLTWEAVPNAVSYSISVNEEAAVSVTTPGYAFAEEAGNYAVKVVAVAADAKDNSDQASFDYTTAYTALGAVAFNEETARITWSGFAGAAIQYSLDGAEAVTVEGDYIQVEAGGMYDIQAIGGFVAENNKFYVDNAASPNVKHILARASQMTEALVLEDGSEDSNTDLQEKYDCLYYGSSGWAANSNAVAKLDRNNEGISPSRSVRMQVFCNGGWFKWMAKAPFQCQGAVDSLSFYAKATAPATASLYFRWEVTEDTMIAGQNFKNVYVTYKLDQVPSGWHKYTVSMTDANWAINYNGSNMTFAQVQGLLSGFGYQCNSLGDFFQYFGNFAILAKCASTGNGPKGYVYVDEVQLNAGEFEVENKNYEVKEWAFSSSAISNGYFKYVKDNASANTLLVKLANGTKIKMAPTVEEQANNKLHVVCDGSYTLDATFTVGSDGKLTLDDGATGNVATYLGSFQSDLCHVVDDFESYANSGVGFDHNHQDETAWTGLRAKWYSDFYNTGGTQIQSPIYKGDWHMMGSNDYLDVNTSNHNNGTKCLRIKYNKTNQMRFTTWDCANGPAPRLQKGTTLTLYVRSSTSRSIKLKFKVWRNENVNSSIIGSDGSDNQCTLKEVTIAQTETAAWEKVEIALNADANYYGLTILPITYNGEASGDGQYVYIDDIMFHNTIAPLA